MNEYNKMGECTKINLQVEEIQDQGERRLSTRLVSE